MFWGVGTVQKRQAVVVVLSGVFLGVYLCHGMGFGGTWHIDNPALAIVIHF